MIRISNILLWVYYKMTGPFTGRRVLQSNENPGLIVSLTTYPARIDKIWMVIETLLDQTVKPDKIMLWLYEGEFPERENLPADLLKLEKRGLEIHFCNKNLYPHKKYFYTMKRYPDAAVITVDDDVLYPRSLTRDLVRYHEKYPDSIICTVARKIEVEEGEVMPYKTWENINVDTTPDYLYQMIGAGGVYYPPGSLDPEVFNEENLVKYALKTDDLWLKIMSLKNKTKVACVSDKYSRLFIPLIRKRDRPLMHKNIGQNHNDENIKSLVKEYGIDIKKLIDRMDQNKKHS